MFGACPVIRIKFDNEDGFCEINLTDFNPGQHEAVDPADLAALDDLPVEQPRVLTTKDIDDAKTELQRMHADIVAERDQLNTQAAEQEAERIRLVEVAKLAEQGADGGKLTIAQLREALTARNIEFDPAAKKTDLQALLDADQ